MNKAIYSNADFDLKTGILQLVEVIPAFKPETVEVLDSPVEVAAHVVVPEPAPLDERAHWTASDYIAWSLMTLVVLIPASIFGVVGYLIYGAVSYVAGAFTGWMSVAVPACLLFGAAWLVMRNTGFSEKKSSAGSLDKPVKTRLVVSPVAEKVIASTSVPRGSSAKAAVAASPVAEPKLSPKMRTFVNVLKTGKLGRKEFNQIRYAFSDETGDCAANVGIEVTGCRTHKEFTKLIGGKRELMRIINMNDKKKFSFRQIGEDLEQRHGR